MDDDDDDDDNDCGLVGGMCGMGNHNARSKPVPVPLCPPEIPHEQTWARTRATEMGSRRLTAWAMAQPIPEDSHRTRTTNIKYTYSITSPTTVIFEARFSCGWIEVWGYVTTDGQSVSQSVSMSWRRAHLGTCDQTLILSEFCCVVYVGRPLWREVGSVSYQSLSAIIDHRQDLCFSSIFPPPPILHVTHFMYIQYMQGLVSPGSVQQIMFHHL
jgi:hypothetical protein